MPISPRISKVVVRVVLALSGYHWCLPLSGQGRISTFAGREWVFEGNGKPAINAPLAQWITLAGSPQGELHLADPGNRGIFRVSRAGILFTVVGAGQDGISPDGTPALQARSGGGLITFDPAGRLNYAESGRIRYVDDQGRIQTLSDFSAATAEYRDRGVRSIKQLRYNRQGVLYVLSDDIILRMESPTKFVIVVGAGSIPNAPDGTQATVYRTNSLNPFDFDREGRLIFIDEYACLLRRVNIDGTLETLAGSSSCDVSPDGTVARGAKARPRGPVRTGRDGLPYFTDGTRIRRINNSGRLESVSGPSSGAVFNPLVPTDQFAVASLEFAEDGSLWFSDNFTHQVFSIGTAAGGTLRVVAGNGCFMSPNPRPSSALSMFINRGPTVSMARGGRVLLTTGDPRSTYRVSPDGMAQLSYGDTARTCSEFGVVPEIPGAAGGPSFPQEDALGRVYYMHVQGISLYRIESNGESTLIAGAPGDPTNVGVDFRGDGGPATQAIIRAGSQFWLAPEGDIWIPDENNHRLRRIDKNGIIRTVAGNGTAGYAGDGDTGTATLLNSPSAVAGDAAGNIYISDSGNNRIRRLAPNGVLKTFAGNGGQGPLGDGGLATAARLTDPRGLWIDNLRGDVYVAERGGNRIRKIDAEGIISTVAGNGTAGYTGDGGLATEATLNSPSSVAIDAAGILYIGDEGNRRVRRVVPGRVPTPGDPCIVSTSVHTSYFKSDGGFNRALILTGADCSVSVETAAPWINIVSGATGRGSREVVFEVTPNTGVDFRTAALRAGPETIVVRQAGGPSLVVEPQSVNVNVYAGQGKISVPVRFTVPGGQRNSPVILTNTTDRGAWLGVSKTAATIESSKPLEISLEIDARSLTPGTYRGSIEIFNSLTAEEVRLPVTMTVGSSARRLQLSHTGFSFRSLPNGRALNESLSIVNSGRGTLNWTADATTLSGGNWLSIDSRSGTVTAGANPSQLQISVNSSNLSPGQYYGTVQVRAADSGNSFQPVTVVLSIAAPNEQLEPSVEPAGLNFTSSPGGLIPPPRNFSIRNPSASALTYTASVDFGQATPWFTLGAPSGTVPAGQALPLELRPIQHSLPPGVYRSQVSVAVQGSANPILLSAILIVAPGACVASSLVPAIVSPASRFSAPLGWPIPIRVQISNNCGAPFTDGLVYTSVSSGDSVIALRHVGNGLWTSTWTVRNSSSSPAVLSVRGEIPATTVMGEASTRGVVSTVGVPPPIIAPSGVLNAASFERRSPVAIGSMVSVFGANFSTGQGQASATPLPTALEEVLLLAGERVAPLYFVSPSQVNAQVPFELLPDSEQAFIIRRGNSLSVPETVTVSRSAPAVFTVDGSGTGQGHVYRYAGDGSVSLATSASGLAAGETAVIYATGLGLTNPTVVSGAGSPATAATLRGILQLRVAGRLAEVPFAGLAPGFVGLYQVNFVMPQGLPSGSEATLELEVDGVRSPPVGFATAIVR